MQHNEEAFAHELRGVRAELRALKGEMWAKETTINNMEGQLEELKHTLNISVKRNFMVNAVLNCPSKTFPKQFAS